MTEPDPFVEIAAHYDTGVEADRLSTWGRLEFLRTTHILRRHLPGPPAAVADIGGGPGAYALPLARDGYIVHLLDPMELHVEQARSSSEALEDGELASTQVGDARRLPWPDESMDAALLLGPLYHLTQSQERMAALSEARRVLRPGGLLVAGAISRFASTYDGLVRRFVAEADFRSIVERDVSEGQHRNPQRHPDWFTTAYFHHPEELEREVREGGFDVPALVAVEGPGSWLTDLDWWLGDDERRGILLATIERVELERSLLGASAHFLAVANRR